MTKLTVSTIVQRPVSIVWDAFTNPFHIIRWCAASPDWHTAYSENDVRNGGKFLFRMEARDGSMGFDFSGTYTNVELHKKIEYGLGDSRNVSILFKGNDTLTEVIEEFDAETENPEDMQREGWQSILNNFKQYVENHDMEILHFDIVIQAPVEKVVSTMFDDKQYRAWTSEFNPTSYYVGSWSKGSRIRFVGTDQNGKLGGMVGQIKENRKNQFVSVEYLGLVEGNQDVMEGTEVNKWKGGLENYSFQSLGQATKLSVDANSYSEFKDYFTQTWPKALQKLKELCEK